MHDGAKSGPRGMNIWKKNYVFLKMLQKRTNQIQQKTFLKTEPNFQSQSRSAFQKNTSWFKTATEKMLLKSWENLLKFSLWDLENRKITLKIYVDLEGVQL